MKDAIEKFSQDGQSEEAPEVALPFAAKRSALVYEGILKLIISGDFGENSRLPSEAALAHRFGASRPVVREALKHLRDDGLVVSRQGSGSYVTHRPDNAVLRFGPVGSIADIQRCFEFRVDVEGGAAARAATGWERDDLIAIKKAYDGLDVCIREGQLGVDADAELHLAIARATHNSYYATTQDLLLSHIKIGMSVTRSLSLLRPSERLLLVQREHAAIVSAIEQRDAQAARQAMETHIENARRRMFEGASE